MTSVQDMIRADLSPRGAMETLFAACEHLPGGLSAIGYRKKKRRMGARAHERFAKIAAQLTPDDIAIDLGANVGEITTELARTGAIVHAFEPEPETFKLLQSNLQSYPNVTLHNSAVSGRDGTASLILPASFSDIPRSASKAASIAHDRYRNDEVAAVEVRTTDFGQFLNAIEGRVRLIKMDVEGAEWDVLQAISDAGAMDKFDLMFVETHERLDPAVLPVVRQQQELAAKRQHPYVNLYWT